MGHQIRLKFASASQTSGHLPRAGLFYAWTVSLEAIRITSSIFLVSRKRMKHFCHELYFITATFQCSPVSLITFSLNKMRLILLFSEDILLIYSGIRERFEMSNCIL